MRFLKLVLAAATVGAWVAGSFPAPAAAQSPPSYQSSEPAKDAMMDHPPDDVTVTFDQPLDQSSWMNVLDECGNEIDSGAATVSLNEMTVGVGKTPAGTYKVVYKAVGIAGATGASTSTFEFMVHHGKPCGAGAKKPPHHPRKNDKDPHDDHRDDDEGRDHDEHEDTSPDHSDHSGMDGMGGGSNGSSGHSGHTAGSGPAENSGHGGHGGMHGDGKRPRADGDPETPQTLAGGTTAGPITADGEAVLIGLGLALAVGVLGGWLLRMSGDPTGTA